MKILDTRDLQERLEELEDELTTLEDDVNEAEGEDKEQAEKDLQEWKESEEGRELEELKAISEEVSEWKDGNTLIPDYDFVEYCQELLEDIGDLPKDLPWYIAIDWEQTADNLRDDYSEVGYQGTTYYYRMS